MFILVLAAAVTRIQYSFPQGQAIPYNLTVKFDGYIPILGGQQGKVEVGLKLEATGQSPDSAGHPQVRSEIKDLQLVFNGATLPLGVENIQRFFPPTTISLTPEGKILKSDAPDVKMPIQLPGVDVKRFPDISYLPIEFPADGIEVGHPFSFKKQFGSSQLEYTLTPKSISESKVELDISLEQTFDGFEDGTHNAVDDAKLATSKLTTHVTGKGTATFDRAIGRVTLAHIESDAKTHLTDIATKAESDRDLMSTLDVRG